MGMGMGKGMGKGHGLAQHPLHGAEGEAPVFAVLHKGCSFPKITPGAAASGFFQCLCPFEQHLLPAPRAGGQAQRREGPGGMRGAAIAGSCQALRSPERAQPMAGPCRVPSLSPRKVPTVPGWFLFGDEL